MSTNENMTLEECIHVFEHSRLQCEHFTPEAVCAAYVNALAALHEKAERERPLTLEELENTPDGEPVWVESEWIPKESRYCFVQHIKGYTLLISPHDFPTKDGCVPHWGTDGPDGCGYGQAWTAYRNKPDKALNTGRNDDGG